MAPLRKPDVELRKVALHKVMNVTKHVTDQILFHPQTIFRREKRRRCYCKVKSELEMVLCDACSQWYHFDCVGLTDEQASAAVDWRCGYCLSAPKDNGMCSWDLAIPQGDRKRKKVAPDRHKDDTPKKRGVQEHQDDFHFVGPETWDDVKRSAQEGGRQINLKMLTQKNKARKIVKEGGHHVVDEMSAAGLQAREVDDVLVDDLLGQGLLDEEDDGEDEVSDDN